MLKWILVALGGLSILALGTGAVEARLSTAGGTIAVSQHRSLSTQPVKAEPRTVPAGTHLGGLEVVPQAPPAAPATTAPAQAQPAQGVGKPGCGLVVGTHKAIPACAPG
jgi:hypothetical protein